MEYFANRLIRVSHIIHVVFPGNRVGIIALFYFKELNTIVHMALHIHNFVKVFEIVNYDDTIVKVPRQIHEGIDTLLLEAGEGRGHEDDNIAKIKQEIINQLLDLFNFSGIFFGGLELALGVDEHKLVLLARVLHADPSSVDRVALGVVPAEQLVQHVGLCPSPPPRRCRSSCPPSSWCGSVG
jgi:hypothetical protein